MGLLGLKNLLAFSTRRAALTQQFLTRYKLRGQGVHQPEEALTPDRRKMVLEGDVTAAQALGMSGGSSLVPGAVCMFPFAITGINVSQWTLALLTEAALLPPDVARLQCQSRAEGAQDHEARIVEFELLYCR